MFQPLLLTIPASAQLVGFRGRQTTRWTSENVSGHPFAQGDIVRPRHRVSHRRAARADGPTRQPSIQSEPQAGLGR